MRYPVISFNAGELSPLIDSRSDIGKYRSGCRVLENMIPRIYGPAVRRPGTKYIESCNGIARVIPFIYSTAIAYMVLLEDQVAYFYYDGGEVLDGGGDRLDAGLRDPRPQLQGEDAPHPVARIEDDRLVEAFMVRRPAA